MGIFITWIILSFIVGAIGADRSIGFWGAFLISLILSPLIGFLVTISSTSKASIAFAETQKKTNELLSNQAHTSQADELIKLQSLRTNGTINEDEYEKMRAKIIG